MKLKGHVVGVFAAVVLLQVGAAQAYKTEVIVKAENKADFIAVVAAVHQQMQPGGRYEHASAKERDAIDAHLADMQSLFDKYGTVAQMDQGAKIQLFNDQEAVNGALTYRDNKRLVCESVAPVGSHIPRTTCRTYGQIMQSQRDTQQVMSQMQQVPQLKSGH